jgi:intergrase/recombinase
MSFRDIGMALGRSERWANLAVAAAERREHAKTSGRGDLEFDGSILALRKFTSSELLDAGFNISVVAQRQGHGAQVLTRHYSKSRASSDKRAAEHLGRIVHGKG